MSCMPRTQDESSHPSADLAGLDEVWDARSKVTLIHCFRDEPNIWNVNVVYRSDSERRQALNEAWRRIEQRMTAMGFNFDCEFRLRIPLKASSLTSCLCWVDLAVTTWS